MKSKHGFTIVELVIVIAVIAILAAVLIPTFSGVIEQANKSADMESCREMNLTLITENNTSKELDAVRDLLETYGFSVDPRSDSHSYYFIPDDNRIVLVDNEKKVEYPVDYSERTFSDSWKLLGGAPSEENNAQEEKAKKEITYANSCRIASGDLIVTPSQTVTGITAVKIDGNPLESGQYSFSGNDVTLTDAVLSNLDLGYHDVTLVGSDGEFTGTIKIAGAVIAGTKYLWDSVCEMDGMNISSTEISEFSQLFSAKKFSSYFDTVTEISFPDSVTYIGSAFCYGSTSLTTVALPKGINSVDNCANVFEDCSALIKVYVPKGTQCIGNQQFLNCVGLTDFFFDGTQSEWNAITKGSSWNEGTGNYTVHCTDGSISKN